MRGGDAGWGHKQGEAEEEKAERESPALEYTATTRRQREGEKQRDWLIFGGSKGNTRRCGYELKRNTARGRDRVSKSPNLVLRWKTSAPKPSSLPNSSYSDTATPKAPSDPLLLLLLHPSAAAPLRQPRCTRRPVTRK